MYAVKLIENAVSVDEAEGTVPVCAVLIGRYDGIIDNITVTLHFTDSLLAGTIYNIIQHIILVAIQCVLYKTA